jgi:hypothetical protein
MPFALPPMPVFIRFVRPVRSMISRWLSLTRLIPPFLLARRILLPLIGPAVRHWDRCPDKLLDIAKERNLFPVA